MKARYLLILSVIAAGFSAQQIIAHRAHAGDIEEAIRAQDQTGTDSSADQAVLKAYTAKHMGTGTTVFLEESYKKATAAAQAASNPNSNGQIYAAAQAACAGRADSVTQSKCVQNYLATHSAPNPNPQPVVMPKKSDYEKKFDAPAWTADTAGIAFLVAIALLGMSASLVVNRR